MFWLPISIVSDNGPCFTSAEFNEFMSNCGVNHITTAVYKPSTNGLAERMVQTFKKSLKKSTEPLQLSMDRFLFNYRMTPHSTTGVSPGELMFGRKLRCRLDLLYPKVSDRVLSKQEAQKRNHAVQPRKVDLHADSPIMVKNYGQYGASWLPATVEKQTGPLSYRCKLSDGRTVKRHQDQLHRRLASPTPPLRVFTPEIAQGTEELSSVPIPLVQAPLVSSADPVQVLPDHQESPLAPRRSTRIRKPVARLDL